MALRAGNDQPIRMNEADCTDAEWCGAHSRIIDSVDWSTTRRLGDFPSSIASSPALQWRAPQWPPEL